MQNDSIIWDQITSQVQMHKYIVQSLENMTLWIPIIKLAQAHMMWIFKVECQENKNWKLFYLTSLRPIETNILKIVLNLIGVQHFHFQPKKLPLLLVET